MIWWSFFIPWISSTGKKCVRVLVHTTWVIATPTHCKALNCVDTWPQQTCDQPAESLDRHSVCWWKYRCTAVDRTDTTLSESFYFALFLLLKYFRSLHSFPACLLLQMHACCTSTVFSAIQNCGFSPQPGEWRTGEMGEDSQAWTRLYDFQQHLHNCMHLMQREYTVPAWMITSYLQTAP